MYNVNGFLFETEEQAVLARKEEEGVRYLKEHTPLDNPEIVLQLYNKLLREKLFVTIVGQRFLIELQDILRTSGFISAEEILPIEVLAPAIKEEAAGQPVQENVKKNNKKKNDKKKNDKKEAGNYKKPFYIALFFAIVFGLSIIGMFVITEMSGNNVNIMNYRNEILNEYSEWENQLKEKEDALKEWEAQLQQKEAGSSNEVVE